MFKSFKGFIISSFLKNIIQVIKRNIKTFVREHIITYTYINYIQVNLRSYQCRLESGIFLLTSLPLQQCPEDDPLQHDFGGDASGHNRIRIGRITFLTYFFYYVLDIRKYRKFP